MSDKNTSSGREQSSNVQSKTQKTHDENATDQANQFSGLANRFLWADSKHSVERVIFWLGLLCVVLFVLDFIVHRHAYAPGEGLPGFYAVVGFGAFTLIVLGAAQLRRLILRNERYYSPNSIDAEPYPSAGLEQIDHESITDPQLSHKNGDDPLPDSSDQTRPSNNGSDQGGST